MKKTWNAPSIETLDVRMTEDGFVPYTYEGEAPFVDVDTGEVYVILPVHS